MVNSNSDDRQEGKIITIRFLSIPGFSISPLAGGEKRLTIPQS